MKLCSTHAEWNPLCDVCKDDHITALEASLAEARAKCAELVSDADDYKLRNAELLEAIKACATNNPKRFCDKYVSIATEGAARVEAERLLEISESRRVVAVDRAKEAEGLVVWAVRNQVEALGVAPQVDIFAFGRHRTRCDGTPAGIIDALHRVRAAERLVELI